MNWESLGYLATFLVFSGLSTYFATRKFTKKQMIASIQAEVLGLFLYAEKQDWINEDKMGWVVQQVYNRIPVKVLKLAGKFFDQEDVENLVEHLYQQAKERLVEGSKLQ